MKLNFALPLSPHVRATHLIKLVKVVLVVDEPHALHVQEVEKNILSHTRHRARDNKLAIYESFNDKYMTLVNTQLCFVTEH